MPTRRRLALLVVAALAVGGAAVVAADGDDDEEPPPPAPTSDGPRQLVAVTRDDPGAAVVLDLAVADDEVVDAVALGDRLLVDVGNSERADRLVVLDPATGVRVSQWSVPDGGFAHPELGVGWGDLFVLPVQGDDVRDEVVAVDVATGTVAWTSMAPDRLTAVEHLVVVDDDTLAVVETTTTGAEAGTPRPPRVRFLDRSGAATATSPSLDATAAPAGVFAADGRVVLVVRDRAVPVAPDGTVGDPVSLPVCALAASRAGGDLLLVGVLGSDCSRDRHDLDVEHVVRVDWPTGEEVWDVVVDASDVDDVTPVLLPSPDGDVVALVGVSLGGVYAPTALDAADGEELWHEPRDGAAVGPGGALFELDFDRDLGHSTLTPIDVRTREPSGATVDTGSDDLPAGLTATHLVVTRDAPR